jgi:hypothetical protein
MRFRWAIVRLQHELNVTFAWCHHTAANLFSRCLPPSAPQLRHRYSLLRNIKFAAQHNIMSAAADCRLFVVDALEPETLLRLKQCLLKYANYVSLSTSKHAAAAKVGVFHIARNQDSNEVQLKVRLGMGCSLSRNTTS